MSTPIWVDMSALSESIFRPLWGQNRKKSPLRWFRAHLQQFLNQLRWFSVGINKIFESASNHVQDIEIRASARLLTSPPDHLQVCSAFGKPSLRSATAEYSEDAMWCYGALHQCPRERCLSPMKQLNPTGGTDRQVYEQTLRDVKKSFAPSHPRKSFSKMKIWNQKFDTQKLEPRGMRCQQYWPCCL